MGKKLETLKNLLNERQDKQTVFSEGPAPLTTDEKRGFAEALQTFSHIGESVYSKRKLEDAVANIEKLVETAQRFVNETSEDVVESTAAGRHFKYMDAALKEFKKSATEILIHERKCTQAYEDIAEGLKKYYELG